MAMPEVTAGALYTLKLSEHSITWNEKFRSKCKLLQCYIMFL